jgi:hypothetical protein
LPVKLYRLNFSIGTQLGHVSKGIEFDIRPLEQESSFASTLVTAAMRLEGRRAEPELRKVK